MKMREKGKDANKLSDDAVDGDRAALEDDLTACRRAVSVIIRTLSILPVLEKCFSLFYIKRFDIDNRTQENPSPRAFSQPYRWTQQVHVTVLISFRRLTSCPNS